MKHRSMARRGVPVGTITLLRLSSLLDCTQVTITRCDEMRRYYGKYPFEDWPEESYVTVLRSVESDALRPEDI